MPPTIMEFIKEYYYLGTLAFCVGSALALWNMTRNKIPFPLGVIALTIAIYAGLVGARLFYVASHHPTLLWYSLPRALVFWQGNLSWFGGPPVGFFAMFLVLKAARRPFWTTAGLCAPAFCPVARHSPLGLSRPRVLPRRADLRALGHPFRRAPCRRPSHPTL